MLSLALSVPLGISAASASVTTLRPASTSTSTAAITGVSYSLIRDVGGNSVKKGDTVTLTFGPAGKLYLLATSPTGDLAFLGRWSYSKRSLSLGFTSSGFRKAARFVLNLGARQIVIPFHVFDSKHGSSLWKRSYIDPVAGAYRVAEAVSAQAANGVPIAKVIAAAGSYVAGITGAKLTSPSASSGPGARAGGPASTDARPRLKLGHFSVRSAGGAAQPAPDLSSAPIAGSGAPPPPPFTISSVLEIASGLVLGTTRHSEVNVVLDSFDAAGGNARPLLPGPLVGDPRVHLHAKPPGIGTDDPPHKTALFIDPFLNTRYIGWEVFGKNYLPAVLSLSNAYAIKVEKSTLEKDSYSVTQLADGKATVSNIVSHLRSAPGVLMIETHGGANGMLATGSYLGTVPATALSDLSDLQSNLHLPAGSLAAASVPSIGGPQYFAALMPKFWTALESSGSDFSRSLVYVGACYTDVTPALREAVKARAYFAYQQEAFSGLLDAVGNYLIRMLARPTVTAEEVYYNMARIDQTGLEIYVEDLVFNGELYPQVRFYNGKNVKSAILGVLDGYGYDGHSVVPYAKNGWLSPELNHAQVWWLVFASRWGQDTKTGVANLVSCWDSYWSKGNLGGLASPFCNAANDGTLPTKNEVYYAIYLVSGQKAGFPFTIVPRFTLNDGR